MAAPSRFRFHRLFRAVIGETAAQSVRRIRLNRVAAHLALTCRHVGLIARKIRYPNHGSFTRRFSDAYGQTPVAFRKRGHRRPMDCLTMQKVTPMFFA